MPRHRRIVDVRQTPLADGGTSGGGRIVMQLRFRKETFEQQLARFIRGQFRFDTEGSLFQSPLES